VSEIGLRPDAVRAPRGDDRGNYKKEVAMKTILIATDGSPSALEAVEFGLELAKEQGVKPIFVHAVPAVDVLPGGGFGITAAVPHDVTDHDRAPLDEAAELAEKAGVHARTRLLKGDAVNEIVAYADNIDADLIVLGSRGHGAIANALLGSVSRGVLHDARRPVLIVRGTHVSAEAVASRR
jgi:nucleotide-binding universal stress UspA family protein